jgi:hypothetical protein
LLGSLTLYLTNEQQVAEISMFSAVLCWCRACPFPAAVSLVLIERSPLNAFATWRRLATMSAYLPRLPRGPVPTAGPPAGDGIGIVR